MKALFCGFFDPFTLGHKEVVGQALKKYDEVIINIGFNENKQAMFSVEERMKLITDALNDCPNRERIRLNADPRMTIDIAANLGANILIRGIRQGSSDFESEQNLAQVNAHLAAIRGFELKTDFIVQQNPFLCSISSSSVKRLCEMKEFIAAASFVPENVHKKLMEIYLYPLWQSLFVPDCPQAKEFWQQLVTMYNARSYHSLSHLGYMFNMLKIYLNQPAVFPDFSAYKNLVLAIFLHDVVHETGDKEKDNEAASAAWGERLLPYLVADISLPEVKKLIMATTHKQEDLSGEQALIADLDLALFGVGEKLILKRINHQIRQEYLTVDDQSYNQNRKELLSRFLKRPRIFQTEFFYRRFEQLARKNIEHQILGTCNIS